MARLVIFVVDLFLLLPWWGAVGVLVLLAVGLWALAHHAVRQLRRNDEYFDPDTDGMFANDDFGYFWIEATIAPQETQAVWDPSMLALVPVDFQPDTEFEFCGQTALLHTLEVWRNGRFESQGAQNVTGTQRLRMLFAIHNDVRQAKFTYHFTHFGRVALPVHVALSH
jgi:hypothetical protein